MKPVPESQAPRYDFSVVRQLRTAEGLTLSDVSRRSGVSVPVLSKLERNQTQAELDTLFRLGRVFGLRAADLLALAESRTAQRGRGESYEHDGFAFRRVAFNALGVFHATVKKGSRTSRPEIHRDDYETCWVLKGRVEVVLPDETHELRAGDVLQFDAILHHTYHALADSELILVHQRKAQRF